MKQQQPINLKLTSLSFPPMAIASILHRISGIVLFLFLPFIMYCVYASLRSPESFIQVKSVLATAPYMCALWAFITAMIYHILAGTRHILMDFGVGEHLPMGRYTAWLVIAMALILSVLVGIWLW